MSTSEDDSDNTSSDGDETSSVQSDPSSSRHDSSYEISESVVIPSSQPAINSNKRRATDAGLENAVAPKRMRRLEASAAEEEEGGGGGTKSDDEIDGGSSVVLHPVPWGRGVRNCPNCSADVYWGESEQMICESCGYAFCSQCLQKFPCHSKRMMTTCRPAKRNVPGETEVEYIQLFVRFFHQTGIVKVPKNCLIEDLFRALYYHPLCPKTCGLRVATGQGYILLNNQGKRLQDYSIEDGSNLTLMLRLLGG